MKFYLIDYLIQNFEFYRIRTGLNFALFIKWQKSSDILPFAIRVLILTLMFLFSSFSGLNFIPHRLNLVTFSSETGSRILPIKNE